MNSEVVKYIETELEIFKKKCEEYSPDSESTIGYITRSCSGNEVLINIADRYLSGFDVPMDIKRSISIFRFVLDNKESFQGIRYRAVYRSLTSASMRLGNTDDYLIYKALSGEVSTDEGYSLLMESLDFDDFEDLVEVTRNVCSYGNRYYGNLIIKGILAHDELCQGIDGYAEFLKRVKISSASFISDENLETLYTIGKKVISDYDRIKDPEGELAYELYGIMKEHDGINRARLWLETSAMRGNVSAIAEYVKLGNYSSVSLWKDSVKGLMANEKLSSKVMMHLMWAHNLIELPEGFDFTPPKGGFFSSNYYHSLAISCYNNGDYSGFASNCLKTKYGGEIGLDKYSLAVIHNGLGMERDPGFAKCVPRKNGSPDSEAIRRKLAEGFNLTSWGEPLTD